MRTALLSALPDPRTGGDERLAFRRFAGKSVLAHQIDCAAILGCQRAICIVTGLGQEVAAARRYAQEAGLRFETVSKNLELAALITASDELLVFADGILPDRSVLVDSFANGRAILSFPAEQAVPLGFERIDASRAWSGAMLIQGATVSRLMDLPPDCNVVSSLLRIALQGGAVLAEAKPDVLEEGTWLSRVDRGTTDAKQWLWITRQVKPASFRAPVMAMIERIGLRLAHDMESEKWSNVPVTSSLVALLVAVLAIAWGSVVAGLAALFAASAFLTVSDVFHRVRSLGAIDRSSARFVDAVAVGRDIILAIVLAAGVQTAPSWLEWFLALMAVGSLYLGSKAAQPNWRETFGDRPLVLVVFLAAWVLGYLLESVAVVSLLGVAAALLASISKRAGDNGELTM